VSKWIKYHESSIGISAAIEIFNRVVIYWGSSDHWGIGANINLYERSITFEILNLYAGIEIYHKDMDD
jgi:hypothetical protein